MKQIHPEVQRFLTPGCGPDQEELRFPISPYATISRGGEGVGIHSDLIPTWNLNVGPGKCSICSTQDSKAQLISMQ